MTETSLRTQPLPRTAPGLSEAEAARLLAVRGPLEPPADEPLVREHRPRQRLHGLQPDPRRRRRRDVRLRRLGGRALPRDPRRQLGDRDRPGGAGEARPRPARRARRADTRRSSATAAPRAGRASTRSSIGDLVRVQAGDQLVADGRLEQSDGPDARRVDPDRRVAGRRPARRRGGAVGLVRRRRARASTPSRRSERAATRSRSPTSPASFRHPRSPLEHSLNRLLLALVAIMVPLGAMLGYALWAQKKPLAEAVPTAVAAVVTLVPEGLILLTSLTFAVAALRMARRGALAQQLNAIESLASAEMICLDKTGTLTENALEVVEAVPARGRRAGGARGTRSAATRRARARGTPRSRRSEQRSTAPGEPVSTRGSRSPRGGAGARSRIGELGVRARCARALPARRADRAGARRAGGRPARRRHRADRRPRSPRSTSRRIRARGRPPA